MSEELLPVGTDELDRFKIGKESNGLYFDGKRVQTESVIVLSGNQGIWAIVVAVSALVGAAAGAISAYVALQDQPTAVAVPGRSISCTTVVEVDRRTGVRRTASNHCHAVGP